MLSARRRNQPQTREEMLKLRAEFQNSIHLSAHFYEDPDLQLQFRILYLGARPTIDLFKCAISIKKLEACFIGSPPSVAPCRKQFYLGLLLDRAATCGLMLQSRLWPASTSGSDGGPESANKLQSLEWASRTSSQRPRGGPEPAGLHPPLEQTLSTSRATCVTFQLMSFKHCLSKARTEAVAPAVQ